MRTLQREREAEAAAERARLEEVTKYASASRCNLYISPSSRPFTRTYTSTDDTLDPNTEATEDGPNADFDTNAETADDANHNVEEEGDAGDEEAGSIVPADINQAESDGELGPRPTVVKSQVRSSSFVSPDQLLGLRNGIVDLHRHLDSLCV